MDLRSWYRPSTKTVSYAPLFACITVFDPYPSRPQVNIHSRKVNLIQLHENILKEWSCRIIWDSV